MKGIMILIMIVELNKELNIIDKLLLMIIIKKEIKVMDVVDNNNK